MSGLFLFLSIDSIRDYFIKSLRRSTKLLLRYFSRTILFSANSSGVPWNRIFPSNSRYHLSGRCPIRSCVTHRTYGSHLERFCIARPYIVSLWEFWRTIFSGCLFNVRRATVENLGKRICICFGRKDSDRWNGHYSCRNMQGNNDRRYKPICEPFQHIRKEIMDLPDNRDRKRIPIRHGMHE